MAIKKTPLFQLSYGSTTIDYDWNGEQAKTIEAWKIAGVDPAEWIENGPTPHGTINGEPIGPNDIDRAKTWAESFIAQTTDYAVVDWQGMAPVLEIQAYDVTFVMAGGEVSANITKRAMSNVISRFECPATYSADFLNGTTVEIPRSRDTITVEANDGTNAIVTINLNNVSYIMRQEANRIVEVKVSTE